MTKALTFSQSATESNGSCSASGPAAARSTEPGPPRYTAAVVVSPTEYGITRRGITKPVTVILDAALKRA